MRIARSAWRTQPWNNGGGLTHEVWRWAAAGVADDAYDLRLSVAEIDGAQPFSAFPGLDRWLVPLEASALTIVLAGAPAPMAPHHVFAFPGEAPAETRGHGRALDFNVIARRARGPVDVTVGTAAAVGAGRHLAVFALAETTLGGAGGPRLHRDDTWIELAAPPGPRAATAPVVWIAFPA